ncbi:exonuclease domain-containing protein [Mesobacillus jeotgali]|uniref:exonuclease domain-containing protein n=1 Tax=Mesobacillus jeotgali TaxID=129985 RepID=UPI000C81AE0B|nr:exonuclease domain-containing protein [Mesobacillus jeotgali]
MNKENKLGLVVDVETTGLGPDSDEIIELAVKLFSFHEESGEIIDILDEDSYLREPLSTTAQRNYDRAYRIHGISYDLVRGKTFYDEKIMDYFNRTDAIFAHNASFDRSFLLRMYPEVNELNWYCTMKNVKWKNHGFPNSKLLTLLQAHNISKFQTHRAMDDITYLTELLKQQNPNGDYYLKEVLDYGPMRKYQPAQKQRRRMFY